MTTEPHMLTPILAKVETDEELRTVLVDWMAAAWLRHFQPEEALDLAMRIVEEHDGTAFNGAWIPEVITRALWRCESLMSHHRTEDMAATLMDFILNADERYLAAIRALNQGLTDGEG